MEVEREKGKEKGKRRGKGWGRGPKGGKGGGGRLGRRERKLKFVQFSHPHQQKLFVKENLSQKIC